MIGLLVKDMKKSVEFYRRLGLDIPEGKENELFVPIKMGELTFFLSYKEQNKIWDPKNTGVSGDGYRIILEFYLKTRQTLDSKFQELVEYGYNVHLKPFLTSFNTYFAVIKDPDGNHILLSAEP